MPTKPAATPGLRERKKQATRLALGTAALRLTSRRGLDKVRVEEIAAAADVSLRTFNNYFSSKEEAIVSLPVDRASRIGTALDARPPAEPLAEALSRVFVDQYIGTGEPDREVPVPDSTRHLDSGATRGVPESHGAVRALAGGRDRPAHPLRRPARSLSQGVGRRRLRRRARRHRILARVRPTHEPGQRTAPRHRASCHRPARRSTMNLRLALPTLSLCLPWTAAVGQTVLIRDVRLFDGETVTEHRSVLVRDGKIDRVADARLKISGVEIVDGRGRTLLPGLFDAHLHVPAKPEAVLHQLAVFGVTTVLDMFGGGDKLLAEKRLEADDPPDMADLRAAGTGAVAPGSMLGMMMARQKLPPIAGPEEAAAWVDARIAEGSDYIKVIYDEREGGPLSLKTMQAIVAAAHGRGKLVVAHVLAEPQAREAIAAGVDGLAHLFPGDSAGAGFGRLAAQHRVFVIPTLITLYALCGKPQGPALLADPHLEPHVPAEQRPDSMKPADPSRQHSCGAIAGTIRQLVDEHVPILAGTDTALTTGKFLGVVAYGATLHVELKLLVDEGMTPTEALTAATSAPARAFRFTDRGWIRPGMRADLLLVEGDPTRDILATRNIVAVWKRGVRITR